MRGALVWMSLGSFYVADRNEPQVSLEEAAEDGRGPRGQLGGFSSQLGQCNQTGPGWALVPSNLTLVLLGHRQIL